MALNMCMNHKMHRTPHHINKKSIGRFRVNLPEAEPNSVPPPPQTSLSFPYKLISRFLAYCIS